MRSGGAVPLMQNGPFTFNDRSRRVEEQLAFHERYHDRMTRLVGGGNRDGGAGGDSNSNVARAPSPVPVALPSAMGYNTSPGDFCNPTPDYWAEFAKKFEEMGIPRGDGVLHTAATAVAPPPPPPPPAVPSQRGDHVDPLGVRAVASGQWGSLSQRAVSPTRVSEEGVLRRLDWLLHDKDDPGTTDVINLLREVEDVLAHEESRKCDGPDAFLHSEQTGSAISPVSLDLSRNDAARAPVDAPRASAADFHHSSGSRNTPPLPPPPPPPAMTPTAAPSFHHLARSAPLNQPSIATDWSRMSSYQQMEWYRAYYAWMMYYAQYYSAILVGTQQRQGPKKGKQKTGDESKTRCKRSNKTHTSLKDISRECMELASEVDRLQENSKHHKGNQKKKIEDDTSEGHVVISEKKKNKKNDSGRQRAPSPYSKREDDTLYRSDHRHSYLFGKPSAAHTHGLTPAPPHSPKVSPGLTAPRRRDLSSGVRGREPHNTTGLIGGDGECSVGGQRFDPPWLPSRRQLPRQERQQEQRRQVRPPRGSGGRDISWLYKYEGSEEDGRLSDDGEKEEEEEEEEEEEGVFVGEESTAARRSHQHGIRAYSQHAPKRKSVYERKLQEMEQEKPRWCF